MYRRSYHQAKTFYVQQKGAADVSNTRLIVTETDIFFEKHLHELNLSFKQLTTLPESIVNLTDLQKLNLRNNQLTTLPKSFGNLTNLQELNLWKNQLTALPESIGTLTNLQELYLSNNQLTTLPESIGTLTNLHTLYLNNNQLTTLPGSLRAFFESNNLTVYGLSVIRYGAPQNKSTPLQYDSVNDLIRALNLNDESNEQSNAIQDQAVQFLEQMDKLIRCQICLINQKDSSLPCGHTMCAKCIDRLANSKCPFCKYSYGSVTAAKRMYLHKYER